MITHTATDAVPILSLPIQAREDFDLDLYAREYEAELFARALGTHGSIGKKGGPRQTGSLPHKPKLDDREFDEELFARALGTHGSIGKKGGPRQTGSLPHKPKLDDREFDDELFARTTPQQPRPKLLSPTWQPKPKEGHNSRRGDVYSFWERMDLDELE